VGAIYAQRKTTVDPVIGQIKGRGFCRFSSRGLIGAKGEFHLVCAVHNLWSSCGAWAARSSGKHPLTVNSRRASAPAAERERAVAARRVVRLAGSGWWPNERRTGDMEP
jgi:DDE family transposase